jgi:hypothetical protein
MEALKDGGHLYEAERRQFHAQRPGFRINELRISKTQNAGEASATFLVLQGLGEYDFVPLVTKRGNATDESAEASFRP